MKKIALITLLFIGLSSVAQVEIVKNLDQAKTIASNKNENIMIVFSGSDWCIPCMRLEKEILSQPGFENAEAKKLVLIKADFPSHNKNKKLISKSQQDYNAKLFETYNTKGIFPLVVLLDKNGKLLAKTSYKDMSSRDYANYIDNLVSAR